MRCPRGSPRLTSIPFRTMNGLRRRVVESGVGTSTCQPVRSFPLNRLTDWPSEPQRDVEPSAAAIVIAGISNDRDLVTARPVPVFSNRDGQWNDQGCIVCKLENQSSISTG